MWPSGRLGVFFGGIVPVHKNPQMARRPHFVCGNMVAVFASGPAISDAATEPAAQINSNIRINAFRLVIGSVSRIGPTTGQGSARARLPCRNGSDANPTFTIGFGRLVRRLGGTCGPQSRSVDSAMHWHNGSRRRGIAFDDAKADRPTPRNVPEVNSWSKSRYANMRHGPGGARSEQPNGHCGYQLEPAA
jgi:hypothetical protein